MHNLEELIAEWRKGAMAEADVSSELVEELESHLRETVDSLIRSGMALPEAFQTAVAQLGPARKIASEFRKLDESLWFPVKAIAGIAVITASLLAGLLVRSDKLGTNLLLASHVFLVTLGYLSVFFTGALGICFVCQRCFSPFSSSRLQSIARANQKFSSVALGLTVSGWVLGGIWTKSAWGRYWQLDPKEIGALCVIIWLGCFLIAHRFADRNPHRLLATSVLGNIIVGLAWFGPPWALHHYGAPNYSLFLLTTAVAAHIALFLIGLAPPGWLRLRKA